MLRRLATSAANIWRRMAGGGGGMVKREELVGASLSIAGVSWRRRARHFTYNGIAA